MGSTDKGARMPRYKLRTPVGRELWEQPMEFMQEGTEDWADQLVT